MKKIMYLCMSGIFWSWSFVNSLRCTGYPFVQSFRSSACSYCRMDVSDASVFFLCGGRKNESD
jgi:hypothetical protein